MLIDGELEARNWVWMPESPPDFPLTSIPNAFALHLTENYNCSANRNCQGPNVGQGASYRKSSHGLAGAAKSSGHFCQPPCGLFLEPCIKLHFRNRWCPCRGPQRPIMCSHIFASWQRAAMFGLSPEIQCISHTAWTVLPRPWCRQRRAGLQTLARDALSNRTRFLPLWRIG